jgi:hypothetical protein
MVLGVKKSDLMKDLERFPTIQIYMQAMAEEKLKFHLSVIWNIKNQFKDWQNSQLYID